MSQLLTVGDRVIKRGWKFRNEADRFGEVVECYVGLRSAAAPGVDFVAVKWDDTGLVERGYLNSIGELRRCITVPTCFVPHA